MSTSISCAYVYVNVNPCKSHIIVHAIISCELGLRNDTSMCLCLSFIVMHISRAYVFVSVNSRRRLHVDRNSIMDGHQAYGVQQPKPQCLQILSEIRAYLAHCTEGPQWIHHQFDCGIHSQDQSPRRFAIH